MDVRFPTSRENIGSDAVNKAPDYSAAYCILETDSGLQGHGLTFTLGRGTELCVMALEYLARMVKGRQLSSLTEDLAAFSRQLTDENQFRWLGPEKGVIHLASAALVNAVWDLYARAEGKPLWKLLADMAPEQIVRAVDFRYISDALSREEASGDAAGKAPWTSRSVYNGCKLTAILLIRLPPAGTDSATTRCGSFAATRLSQGWTQFKLKVGGDPKDDLRRARLVRDEIGPANKLMVDANQKWGVDEAIARIKELAELDLWWMEEPTSPDDILGHARIRKAVAPVRIATGEHCHNRVMFKQFLQAEAIDVCQIDSCRLAGVNENIAVILLAAKFGVPVCPHAGGVGLCEYVQHLSVFDYLCVSASLENRVIEYVDHLHEHFLDPVRIRNGCYLLPEKPGYSIEMYEATLKRFAFPGGEAWASC